MFKFSYRPQEFFPRGKFLPKITIVGNFWAVRPHFWSYSGEIWHEVRSWGSLPRQYIVKMALRGIPLVGKLYKKIPILSILGAVLQHFSTDSDTIWHEAANLGRPPQAKFCKNCLRGIPLLGKFIPKKNTNFSNICGVSSHFKSENSEIWRECTDPGHPPCPYFCKKNRSGGFVPWGNFYQKFKIFAIISYLSPYFYTDNVKNSLKRTDLGIYKKNKFSSESLKGSAGIALPSGGDAYWFLVLVCDIQQEACRSSSAADVKYLKIRQKL